MSLIIQVKEDLAALIEKRSRYYFWDKERQRSNRAALIHQAAPRVRRCATQPVHRTIGYSGPPHDPIQAWVCLTCGAAACAPEIKDRGHDFWECDDSIIVEIMNLDLQRQAQGNITSYPMAGR